MRRVITNHNKRKEHKNRKKKKLEPKDKVVMVIPKKGKSIDTVEVEHRITEKVKNLLEELKRRLSFSSR